MPVNTSRLWDTVLDPASCSLLGTEDLLFKIKKAGFGLTYM